MIKWIHFVPLLFHDAAYYFLCAFTFANQMLEEHSALNLLQ